MRHAEHRQRRRRAARDRSATRRLAGPGPGRCARVGSRLRSAAQGSLPSRAATRRYAERFSWPKLAERHRELYRRLLAGERDERLRVVYLDHVARLSGGEIALLRLLPHLQRVHAHVILGEDGLLAERLQQAGCRWRCSRFAASARDLRRDAVRWAAPRRAPRSHAGLHCSAGTTPAPTATGPRAHELAEVRRIREPRRESRGRAARVASARPDRRGLHPESGSARDRRASSPRVADGVIANSSATLETLRQPHAPTAWVIPDSVAASAHPHTPGTGPATFGMLGRIAPWKGQDLFLRAFAAAFPGGEERAVIVGTPMFGEEAYERELRDARDASSGWRGRVEFRGFREDIWRELAPSTCSCTPRSCPSPSARWCWRGWQPGSR